VESSIRYLPLYPDDPGVDFRESFFKSSPNILEELLPSFAYLSDCVHVIDVPKTTDGLIMRVLMNAEAGEAVGIVAPPSEPEEFKGLAEKRASHPTDDHWRWRMRMVEQIATQVDAERFAVKGLFVLGSTKNASAGPCSDIDLLIHFGGTDEQRAELMLWLEGWSLCLDEMNYLRTGHRTGGLLDVHFVNDEDIAKRTSYAVKIGAVTDAAKPLPLSKSSRKC
jgi:hypothetical protein